MSKSKRVFYFEVTDTFAGEANYCWVKRHAIKAVSLQGALCILSRFTGINWQKDYDGKWNARNACITCFAIDDDNAEMYNFHWINP